jgi:membrane-associated protease RseP (regulator of RpoE activity)
MLHEASHGLALVLIGEKIKNFAIGIGPEVFRFQGTETTGTGFTLRLLPVLASVESADDLTLWKKNLGAGLDKVFTFPFFERV